MSNQTAAAFAALGNSVNWERKGLDRQSVIDAANQGKLGQPLTDWLVFRGWENGQVSTAAQPKQKATPVNIFRLISAGKDISLEASTGAELLADQAKLFPGFLDRDFVNYETNIPKSPMPATKVEVHEMVRNGDFKKIFDSFNTDLDKLHLSQGQIIQFVKKHPEWLHPDVCATFFLFKSNGQFFVASVGRYDGEYEARVRRFSNGIVWSAYDGHRVVVPQLTLES